MSENRHRKVSSAMDALLTEAIHLSRCVRDAVDVPVPLTGTEDVEAWMTDAAKYLHAESQKICELIKRYDPPEPTPEELMDRISAKFDSGKARFWWDDDCDEADIPF